MKTYLGYTVTSSFLVAIFFSGSLLAEIVVGVNNLRGGDAAMEQWGKLSQYLEEQMETPVRLQPLSVDNFLPAVEAGMLDFVLANPLQSVIMHEKIGATPLASLERKAGTQFAGVIISRKGSGITKGTQLKGKRVISMKHGVAAGAYLFQAYHLYQQGIDVHKDFAAFGEGPGQDALVYLVKNGRFDAAFIRSGLLETMAKEGKISLDDFEIVDQRMDPEVALAHSTIPYPDWFFLATPKTSKEIANKMQTALLALTSDHDASKAANINGFLPPLSTGELRNAMQAMKIPPFDQEVPRTANYGAIADRVDNP